MKICVRMSLTGVESRVWQSSHKTGWYPSSSSTVTPCCSFQGCNMGANPRAEMQEQHDMQGGVVCDVQGGVVCDMQRGVVCDMQGGVVCVRKFKVWTKSAGGFETVVRHLCMSVSVFVG